MGFGWMEENKKSGGGDVRASNSPSEMAGLRLGFAGSDGRFAVGWQFDKFDKFDKFVTLNKLLPGGWLGSNWLLGFYVLYLLI